MQTRFAMLDHRGEVGDRLMTGHTASPRRTPRGQHPHVHLVVANQARRQRQPEEKRRRRVGEELMCAHLSREIQGSSDVAGLMDAEQTTAPLRGELTLLRAHPVERSQQIGRA